MNKKLPLNKKEELKKKLFGTQGIIIACVLFGLFFLIVIIMQACTPRQGSVIYGMCHTFLEQNLPFPETIRHTSVEQYPQAVRIYFTHIDAFGQYQFELIECTFAYDAQQNIIMERVFFNYIKEITEKERVPGKGRLYEVKPKYVELFNRSNSPQIIRSQNPDLSLPSTNTRF